MKIGDAAQTIKCYKKELVIGFSQLTGDINPIHIDSEYAAKTIFKKPIVHGMLVASQISELLANNFPGPGTIYLSQSLNFIKPVYYDDEIKCVVEVMEIENEKGNIKLKTQCYNQENKIVIDGVAIVKLLKK